MMSAVATVETANAANVIARKSLLANMVWILRLREKGREFGSMKSGSVKKGRNCNSTLQIKIEKKSQMSKDNSSGLFSLEKTDTSTFMPGFHV